MYSCGPLGYPTDVFVGKADVLEATEGSGPECDMVSVQ